MTFTTFEMQNKRTPANEKKENSIKLYCNKCQVVFKFDQFNHYDNKLDKCICCCFQLKDVKHKQHYRDRSECCQVCAKVVIINEGFPKYYNNTLLSCNYCSDDIKIFYMDQKFPSLSFAHDYFFTSNNSYH